MIDNAYPKMEEASELADVPPRVLIVDDDEDQAFCLLTRLESLGFEASIAHAGRHALSLAYVDRPDVILLDLRLPDIDGFDVCTTLADDPETCDIPVIIVSGMDRDDVVRSCRAAGSRYYLSKPYDPNVLLTLIRDALNGDF